jgi:hypothetical protein
VLKGLRPASIDHFEFPGQPDGEPKTVFHLRVPTAGEMAEIEDAWQPRRDAHGNMTFLQGTAVLRTLRIALAGWENFPVQGQTVSYTEVRGTDGTEPERQDRALSVIPGDAREVLAQRVLTLGRVEPKN